MVRSGDGAVEADEAADRQPRSPDMLRPGSKRPFQVARERPEPRHVTSLR